MTALVTGLAQVSLRVGLQLLQDHSGDLLGGVALAVDGHLVVGTHFTLDGGHGALRVGDGLALCHLAHHALAGLGEGHHRGSGAGAFRVGDNDGLAAFDNSHTGVCSTQVNANSLCHNKLPSFVRKNIVCKHVYVKLFWIGFFSLPPGPWRGGPPGPPAYSPSGTRRR